MKLKLLLASLAVGFAVAPAHAALTTYDTASQGLFDTTVGSKKVETLDGPDFEAGLPPPLYLFGSDPLTNSAADALAKLSGGATVSDLTPQSGGRKPHSGAFYLEGDANAFTIDFAAVSGPVKAFGFWGSDIGDFVNGVGDCVAGDANCTGSDAAVLRLIVKFDTALVLGPNDDLTDCTANGSTLTCDILGGRTNGNTLFWGITSSSGAAIESVTFQNMTANPLARILDGQGFDDFTIGDVDVVIPTPEPGGVALAALALLSAGWVTRRRSAAGRAQ